MELLNFYEILNLRCCSFFVQKSSSQASIYSLFNPPDIGFDLQLFAAEDEGRTEEPTEYKKRKAREEGKVAKTQELPSALVLLFGFFLLFVIFKYVYRNTVGVMQYYLGLVDEVTGSSENIVFLFKPILPILLKLLGPLLGVTFLAAIIGNVIQVGFKFTTKPIQPDFSRINPNPVRFFQRILFSRQALVNLLKSVFKIATIAVITFLLVRNDLIFIIRTIDMGTLQGMAVGFRIAFKIIMVVSGVLLVLSIPDYLFQRFEHIESLKMSRQELKEERKLLEGDPLLRARMRERQREYSKRRMMQEVPKADVVITNPVHYAVALRYEPLVMNAPTCVAKGQDLIAHRIKQIAEENEVPIVENKPLARELYRRVEVGDEVPEDLFTVVAEVIAFVYRLKERKMA